MLAWGSLSCCFQLGYLAWRRGVGGWGYRLVEAYVARNVRAINWLCHWTMGRQTDTKDFVGHWNSARGASIVASADRIVNHPLTEV